MKRKIIGILLLIFQSSVLGGTGSITGTVTDRTTHAALRSASITLIEPDIATTSDSSGQFAIKGIETGSYNLRISMLGYEAIVRSRVVVKPGKETCLEIRLEGRLFDIGAFVVKPSFFENTKDAVVSSRSMSYEEIVTQPGGGYDIQRAVQALPAVVSANDQDNEIIVRGGNYGENLFVVDNIEIPNPNHFASQGTGGGPINIINTDYVRRIDFMAGAFPARYGEKASSVLDVSLREGSGERRQLKLDMGMAGAGGSIEGPIGKGSYLLSAKRSFVSLIKSAVGLTAVPVYWNTQGKLKYDLSPRNKLTAIALYANDRIFIENESNAYGAEPDISINAKSYQYAFGATLQTLFNNGYALFTLSRTLNYWDHFVTDTLDTETYHNYATEAENSAKIDVTLMPSDRTEASFGVYLKRPEYQFDTWSKPDTLFVYNPETGEIIDTTDFIYSLDAQKQESFWKYGGYLQLKRDIGKRITLTSGLRTGHHDYTGDSYLSPRVGVRLRVREGTSLGFAYGRHNQPPELYQLAYDTANHYLKHKYTDQLVVGIEHLFAPDIRGTIEAYYKRYRDVPIPKTSTTPDWRDREYVYVNKGTGSVKGIELFLQKKVKDNLWGTFSYSYLTARADDPRYPGKKYSWDFDYRHILTVVAGYRKKFTGLSWYESLKRRWWYSFIPLLPADESEYSFRWRYLGGRPYTPKNYHPEYRQWFPDETQSINSERMTSYNRLDIHIEQRWFFDNWNLVSYFEVENVLNKANIWNYQYSDNGTKDSIYQFGRMIVGGVILEF